MWWYARGGPATPDWDDKSPPGRLTSAGAKDLPDRPGTRADSDTNRMSDMATDELEMGNRGAFDRLRAWRHPVVPGDDGPDHTLSRDHHGRALVTHDFDEAIYVG